MPTPDEHALLSASAAHRWLNCTAAPRLEESLPETASSYAKAGRIAHALAELKVRKALVEPMGPKKYASALKKLQADPYYSPDVATNTDKYLDYILGIVHAFPSTPYVGVEVRVNYSNYAPEGFGTSDCIIIGGNDLYIIDYKNGSGVQVDAENNPQMMLYALGALDAYQLFYDIRTIHMAIFQPAFGEPKEWVIDRNKLIDWGVFEVRPKAKEAFEGTGTCKSGDWCRFCRAKGQCSAQTRQSLDALAPQFTSDAKLMGPADYAAILPQLPAIEQWINQVKDAALSRLMSGEDIPGYKVVEGRKTRQFTDGDAAFAALVGAGYDDSLLYERRPLTLSAIEKVVGKSKFMEIAGDYVESTPGKPTLVPISDKRQSINGRITPEEAFN